MFPTQPLNMAITPPSPTSVAITSLTEEGTSISSRDGNSVVSSLWVYLQEVVGPYLFSGRNLSLEAPASPNDLRLLNKPLNRCWLTSLCRPFVMAQGPPIHFLRGSHISRSFALEAALPTQIAFSCSFRGNHHLHAHTSLRIHTELSDC